MTNDLVEVQRGLKNTPCPSCQNKNGMSAILRCDLALEACVIAIQCPSCNSTYELSAEAIEARRNNQVTHICPECHSRPSSGMKISLDVASLQGRYVAAPCDDCTQPVPLRKSA